MSSLEKEITTWYAANKRNLPWRNTTPWGVMVSEFMLQQTPVIRVLPKWHEWMTRWPTPVYFGPCCPWLGEMESEGLRHAIPCIGFRLWPQYSANVPTWKLVSANLKIVSQKSCIERTRERKSPSHSTVAHSVKSHLLNPPNLTALPISRKALKKVG